MAELTDSLDDLDNFIESLDQAYSQVPVVKDRKGNSILPLDFPAGFAAIRDSLGSVSESLDTIGTGGTLRLVSAKPVSASAPGQIGEFYMEYQPTPLLYLYVGSRWVRFDVSSDW
jgi:hypothetical protein